MVEKNYIEEADLGDALGADLDKALEEQSKEPQQANYTVRVATDDYSYIEATFEGFDDKAIAIHKKFRKAFPTSEIKKTVSKNDASATSESSINGDPKCPKCGGDMWDQTKAKWYDPAKKQPTHKCKDKECNGAIWAK